MNRERPITMYDGYKLREWRLEHNMTREYVMQVLDCSQATLYRIEAGLGSVPMFRINRIVRLTRGAVRYRDLIADFNPSYA